MCNPASFIVTRSDVLFSVDNDSHARILIDHNIHDNSPTPDFVPVEISPPALDYSVPLDQWRFHVGRIQLPAWWNAEEAELACREALPRWAAAHFVREGEAICDYGQTRFAFGYARLRVLGGKAWFYDRSVCRDQIRGVVHLYDLTQSHDHAGGTAVLHGCSQAHNSRRGILYLHDDTRLLTHLGGQAILTDRAELYDQVGGATKLYRRSAIYRQHDGFAFLYDHAQSIRQLGGSCNLWGHAESREMRGGHVHVHEDARVLGHLGGRIEFHHDESNEMA